jgi:hypothetical protein
MIVQRLFLISLSVALILAEVATAAAGIGTSY